MNTRDSQPPSVAWQKRKRLCLFDLLNRNAATRFGKKHDFAGIRSVAEFQAQVPITGYDALAESIEAIAGGEPSVLTADRVKLFQPTSGSSSAIQADSMDGHSRSGIPPGHLPMVGRVVPPEARTDGRNGLLVHITTGNGCSDTGPIAGGL